MGPPRRLLGLVVMMSLATMLGACGAARGHGALEPGLTAGGSAGSIAELGPVELAAGERLRVVATTSLVADVVRHVGAEAVDVTQLLPYGADPHGYLATPQDLQRVTEAHLVLINGFGLEESLLDDLQAASETDRVSISEGISPRRLLEEGADHHAEAEGDHSHGVDPHVWMDPTKVMVWSENTARALSALDPANGGGYRTNAEAYRQELESLDRWIERQASTLPSDERLLVTDHLVFGYFADRYQFEMIGAVVPAYSTQAEPSARELAALQDLIESRGVRAVFVGITANPTLARRVSDDLGVPLVPLYTGSLSDRGGPAATYVEMMEYDVGAIVEALR